MPSFSSGAFLLLAGLIHVSCPATCFGRERHAHGWHYETMRSGQDGDRRYHEPPRTVIHHPCRIHVQLTKPAAKLWEIRVCRHARSMTIGVMNTNKAGIEIRT